MLKEKSKFTIARKVGCVAAIIAMAAGCFYLGTEREKGIDYNTLQGQEVVDKARVLSIVKGDWHLDRFKARGNKITIGVEEAYNFLYDSQDVADAACQQLMPAFTPKSGRLYIEFVDMGKPGLPVLSEASCLKFKDHYGV